MVMPTKCRGSDNYKGKREPRCGCDMCAFKWRIAELERQIMRLTAQMEQVEVDNMKVEARVKAQKKWKAGQTSSRGDSRVWG